MHLISTNVGLDKPSNLSTTSPLPPLLSLPLSFPPKSTLPSRRSGDSFENAVAVLAIGDSLVFPLPLVYLSPPLLASPLCRFPVRLGSRYGLCAFRLIASAASRRSPGIHHSRAWQFEIVALPAAGLVAPVTRYDRKVLFPCRGQASSAATGTAHVAGDEWSRRSWVGRAA
ncbi:hypothetical protein P7C73_g5690, partial [Tremellales sp. Uapishka_1]